MGGDRRGAAAEGIGGIAVSGSQAGLRAGRLRRLAAASCAALAATVGVLALASPAGAARGFEVGFADDVFSDNLFTNPDPAVRTLWFDRLAGTNARIVRINVHWARVAIPAGNAPPANPRNPDDPGYNWTEIDDAVREADARGLKVLFTVLRAPTFAEGPNKPASLEFGGNWRPNAAMLGDFAVALATRYSGNAGQPRVKFYEAWNEPNLDRYIAPQANNRGKPVSPGIYREMLNAFYQGVKSVRRNNKVLSAGTAPFGDRRRPGRERRRVHPLEFWRDVFCLRNRNKLKKKRKCARQNPKPKLDIFAHNSIGNPGDGARATANHRDDVKAADMHKMVDLIRAAEKRRTVGRPPKRHKVWSTELWYQSHPPEPRKRKSFGLQRHARVMTDSLYVLWQQKVSAGIFLQIRDTKLDRNADNASSPLYSGVYFHEDIRGGRSKPALRAVRFPFVGDRRNKRKVLAWGIAPERGRVRIQLRRGSRWVTRARTKRVRPGRVFTKRINLRGKAKLRAVVGGERSLAWNVKQR